MCVAYFTKDPYTDTLIYSLNLKQHINMKIAINELRNNQFNSFIKYTFPIPVS